MNTLFLCVATSFIAAGAYGLTWLLWTAVGIGLPKRKRRTFASLKINEQRKTRRATRIAPFAGGRFADDRHIAALPREERDGIGAHLNN